MQANTIRVLVVALAALLVASLWWNNSNNRYQLGPDVGPNGA